MEELYCFKFVRKFSFVKPFSVLCCKGNKIDARYTCKVVDAGVDAGVIHHTEKYLYVLC